MIIGIVHAIVVAFCVDLGAELLNIEKCIIATHESVNAEMRGSHSLFIVVPWSRRSELSTDDCSIIITESACCMLRFEWQAKASQSHHFNPILYLFNIPFESYTCDIRWIPRSGI